MYRALAFVLAPIAVVFYLAYQPTIDVSAMQATVPTIAPVQPLQPTSKVVTDTSNPESMTLLRPNSLTPDEVDRILESYGSPAVGTGQVWYDMGIAYGIDNAYAVAFFIHESTAGTNPNWDGMKEYHPEDTRLNITTHDIGNISCAGYPTCLGRWRDYGGWKEGIEDWFRLIKDEYIGWRGHQTVEDVIPVYAPSFENNVDGYTNVVSAMVADWRTNGVP